MSFTPIALAFCLLLTAGLPLLAARTGIREEQAAEIAAARSAVYLSAAISLVVLGGATFGIAAWQDIPPDALGWTVERPLPAFGWSAAVAAAGLAVVWLMIRAGGWLGWPESRLSLVLMPRTGRERAAFVLLVAVAAVGEEYLYRGYMLHVLAGTTGAWPAVAITAISFGVAHGYQKLIGVARATLLGFLLALPVVQTGSLFPAIVAHFWINAAIGLGGWRRLYPDAVADALPPAGRDDRRDA